VRLHGEGQIRFTGAPRLQLPMPDRLSASSPAPDDSSAGITSNGAMPAPAAASLTEDGPYGPLPRIARDGRRPFLAYALPFNFEDPRPKVAIMVLGLGLQAESIEAALRLPGKVSLHFTPYAADLAALFERARRAGHEVLLDLPMEPLDARASDPGPQALRTENSSAENLKRLSWVLARAPGYVAVAGGGARFAASPAALPVLDVLAQRGLAMIELGSGELATGARAVGLPYASVATAIDADPSSLAIDHALAALEAEALRRGSALGVVEGYPVSLERLRLWAATLEDKGLALAPVSALVIERSGLAAEAPEDGRARSRSAG
jgi:polysaccharide deacetylase 2 family uncharacterized protein YibQ